VLDTSRFCPAHLALRLPQVFRNAREAESVSAVRENLSRYAFSLAYNTFENYDALPEGTVLRVRDCATVLQRMLTRRSEQKSGFSLAKALMDLAHGRRRSDLKPGFYAEVLHLFLGLEGRGPGLAPYEDFLAPSRARGRAAAHHRSRQLDGLWAMVERRLAELPTGLDDAAIARRASRRERVRTDLGATPAQWDDWRWQLGHLITDPDMLAAHTPLTPGNAEAIAAARRGRIPFAITPYYCTLMDEDPAAGRDQAIRAQVIPPAGYVAALAATGDRGGCLDFMRERDTSPVDLVTRRYAAICILKPFNTCPQICVYCQRNWEISEVMIPEAMATPAALEQALAWIRDHPAIREVLITGGDPLAMPDADVERILDAVAAIPSVERIRIGSRTPVTLPMRLTERLADILSRHRVPGRRAVALVTHAQHAYEVTPEVVAAVERLRRRGIGVYNQLVFTFHVSRRFEAVQLRRVLALAGIDPYYTFNTKGKEETADYRVPIARLMQEQKEEAQLLPGLSRTDEAVYNVPGMGKTHLRARQHRDLIAFLPDGSRLYEFHAWEKKISSTLTTYVGADVPILGYLLRLEDIGEDAGNYRSIWYYF
jgi:lysine 2,3-aminomutase